MSSIHGHEVLQMMLASGESWTVASLEAAIRRRFGEEARFHTCSAENLSAAELVAFLEKKANLLPEEGFTTAENKICRINGPRRDVAARD
jgi:probable metal-binding protein